MAQLYTQMRIQQGNEPVWETLSDQAARFDSRGHAILRETDSHRTRQADQISFSDENWLGPDLKFADIKRIKGKIIKQNQDK